MNKSKNFLQTYIVKLFRSHSNKEGQGEKELEQIAAQEQKVFAFETLVAATRDFHATHKLGEGGFGPVYKGKLNDGREIAVKRLSHTSNQGRKEFMNEAKLLARVQHRNVVNLLGYCVHGSEKLLVYEYVPHESLDKLLFKSNKREELDWKRRYDIICGVARGLLYLHEDSHNCIIHRDIKASNILLDDKWIPKIADFGMARLFPEDQTHVNTRVAGTNGYMAPEYVMHGHLSVKADVFSFGVLVLELISGQRNSSFNLSVDAQSLLDWAYKLYKKGKSLDILDAVLAPTAVTEQVAMCIQIGLLCTQGDPTLRPTMHRVVVILSKKPSNLEEPTRPGVAGTRYRRSRRPGALSSTAGTSGESNLSDSSFNTNTGTGTTSMSQQKMSTNSPPQPKTGTSSRSHKSDTRGKRPIE
ncbi:Cysteine-rich receptor-like protein kinase 10 [Morus notabilis]|uniref:Cysteine-rich receptor-like protein kinase 10 n=1 Tax=Morus notabilis TaxID=981085 RepID=W9RGU7_9ROSA|nr:putative receptor-like protein kinase At4g00960 [Morus notabilis]EXB90894.1 Cysteine-rich receptor-like protein kinase 10 [Morus notabilis]